MRGRLRGPGGDVCRQDGGCNASPSAVTYTCDTLGAGESEIEQYVDVTPVVGISGNTGRNVCYAASQFQTEFEYGITDRLELGLDVTLAPTPNNVQNAAVLTEGTGLKQRLRYRLFDESVLPLDIGLYGELVENDIEFEIEAKILLERRIGNLRIDANLWAEREWYLGIDQRDWVINPTGGLTYQIMPAVHVGAEFWMRGEWPDPAPAVRPFRVGPHEFVGPTVLFELGKLSWSSGSYLRVDDMGHTALPADNYGPAWFRTIIGVSL